MCGSSANTRITHVCRRQKRFHISPFRTDCWSWADNCLIALFNFSSNLVFIFVFHFISVLLVVVHAFMKWRQNIRLAPETIFGWFTWKGAFLLPHSRTQKYKIKRSSRRRHRYVSIFAICAIWKEKTTKNVCCSRQSIYTSVADFFPSFLCRFSFLFLVFVVVAFSRWCETRRTWSRFWHTSRHTKWIEENEKILFEQKFGTIFSCISCRSEKENDKEHECECTRLTMFYVRAQPGDEVNKARLIGLVSCQRLSSQHKKKCLKRMTNKRNTLNSLAFSLSLAQWNLNHNGRPFKFDKQQRRQLLLSSLLPLMQWWHRQVNEMRRQPAPTVDTREANIIA